jgi:hypothetical protein
MIKSRLSQTADLTQVGHITVRDVHQKSFDTVRTLDSTLIARMLASLPGSLPSISNGCLRQSASRYSIL